MHLYCHQQLSYFGFMRFRHFAAVMLACGMLLSSSTTDQAPAHMTMIFSLKSDADVPPTLHYTIQKEIYSSFVTVHEGSHQFKRISNEYELLIEFNVEDITQPLKFLGKLTLKSLTSSESLYDFKGTLLFQKKELRRIKHKVGMAWTFYDASMTKELAVVIRAECKKNFYPEHICNTFCMLTENTKRCDSNGNKICHQGYFLNSKTKRCDHDWCWPPASKCLNGGRCINLAKRFECQCTLSYRGDNCEKFINYCEKFKCPNGTACVLENEKVNCKQKIILKKSSSIKTSHTLAISLTTMIVVAVSIAMVAVGIFITVWGCRPQKELEYKCSAESVSFQAPTYRNHMNTITHRNSVALPMQSDEHCACKCNEQHPSWNHGQQGNYYSLQYPNHRENCGVNRRYSDLIMSRTGERRSRTPSVHTTDSNYGLSSDTLPLPPVIEPGQIMNNELLL